MVRVVLTGSQLLSGGGWKGVVERLWQQHREEVRAVQTGLVAGGRPTGQMLPLQWAVKKRDFPGVTLRFSARATGRIALLSAKVGEAAGGPGLGLREHRSSMWSLPLRGLLVI